MLVVVAIEAKQFPVAAVRGVVIVVMVPMVDREFLELPALEFAAAARTNVRIQLQRLFPVLLLPEFAASPGLGNEPLLFVPGLFIVVQ